LGAVLPEPVIMLYGMTIHTLWFAPIFCWLLFVSAWAKRAPILWALLPPLAIAGLERMTFNTWYFMNMLQYRMGGAIREGFATKPGTNITHFTELTPLNFLSAPGLWVGLMFAAANRDPRKWPAPDQFDIRRDLRGNLGWGYGVHACVGRSLALLEAEALLKALIRHIERFEPAGEPEPWMTTIGQGPARLPVRIHAA
jgi:hypothetical protein